jgi:imidazole glycerol phosphate synthase subunit HisF
MMKKIDLREWKKQAEADGVGELFVASFGGDYLEVDEKHAEMYEKMIKELIESHPSKRNK